MSRAQKIMLSKSDLELVNYKVNLLPYQTDAANFFTPEFWQRISIKQSGDCEDYAIEKYQRLILNGWPLENLRFATCWIHAGMRNEDYHAGLIARLNRQDYWLDSIAASYPHPTEIELVRYEFHKVQVAGSQEWEYEKRFAENHPELCIHG